VSYAGPRAQRLIADIAKMLDERVLWQSEATHATRLLQEAREHNACLRAECQRKDAAVTRLYEALDSLVREADSVEWSDRWHRGKEQALLDRVYDALKGEANA
jgi:hypothetical protein